MVEAIVASKPKKSMCVGFEPKRSMCVGFEHGVDDAKLLKQMWTQQHYELQCWHSNDLSTLDANADCEQAQSEFNLKLHSSMVWV